MKKRKSFAQTVREQYGDDINEFAFRMSANPVTVEKWENGSPLQGTAKSLLKYASQYELTMKPEVNAEFQAMSTSDQVTWLMNAFGDNKKKLAARLGVSEIVMIRWSLKGNISNTGQRLLFEAAAHPERFLEKTPQPYSK